MLNHMSHHVKPYESPYGDSPSLLLKTVCPQSTSVLLHPGVGVHALELPLDLVLEGLLLDPTRCRVVPPSER